MSALLTRSRRRVGLALAGVLLGAGAAAVTTSPANAAPAADVTNVRVAAGSTIQDSGLYDGVFAKGFAAAYPQFHVQFFSLGTNAAINYAESGKADVTFTHSDQLEAPFVSQGYSYEPGGRLIMTSDFVTVGPPADPAGAATGVAHDAVAAFRAIAAAGNAGKAEFLSRNDASGTNVKELTIWKLTGLRVDGAGHPVEADGTTPQPWYHETNQTQQGANLQLTDQCRNYTSSACYTLVDRGTYNTLVSTGVVTRLKVVSEQNTAPTAQGGVSLLTNPYHAYAVNPAKEPGVNLPGALAFLNYLTAPATQAAIADFPSAANPAFIPDARPDVTVTGLPATAVAANPILLSGTLTPHYPLDPPLAGATVQIIRTADPTTTLATTSVAPDGTWRAAFKPPVSGAYTVVVPQSLDHLVGTTSNRQPTSISAGVLDARASTSLSLPTRQRVFTLRDHRAVVRVLGSALPQLLRKHATIRIQVRKGNGAWHAASPAMALRANTTRYAAKLSLGSIGTWQLRSVYNDPGVVTTAYSRAFFVHVV